MYEAHWVGRPVAAEHDISAGLYLPLYQYFAGFASEVEKRGGETIIVDGQTKATRTNI